MSDYAQTGYSRVFLIEGGARPDHVPVYQGCMRAGGVSKSWGDVTDIECPSATEYDVFNKVGEVKGSEDRATMDLMGRYLADMASDLLRIGNIGCGVDVQIHFGKCQNPNNFNVFTKAVVLEGARITDWSTDDLGAMESGERNPVTETGSISARDVYEILTLSFALQAASIVTNEVIDVVFCDQIACGECASDSNGCEHIYAITAAAGGSAGTAADIVHTVDGGVNWYADDIDTLGAAEDPSAICCLDEYIVVVSNASASAHYALKSEVDDVDYDEAWTEQAGGIVAGGEPNDCSRAPGGRYLYVVGDGGYVYRTEDITGDFTVLDAGETTTENLLCVHAYSDDFVVAGGNRGVILYTENGQDWAEANNPGLGIGHNINCIWALTEVTWFVGFSTGTLYYTANSAADWAEIEFPGHGAGVVYDICFSTASVGYLAHATAAPAGRILRTYNGGQSWQILPEDVGTIPANDYVGALAACIYDPNIVVGGGLADDAADGFLVIAND